MSTKHGAGPSGCSDVERFAHRSGDIAGVRHQVVVFGDGQSDAGDVGFLKGVGADQLAAHLAGDADDGRGVHHGRGNARDHVGGAGAGGGNRHSHLAAGSRVSIGHVRCTLFMPHQNVVDVAARHGVVGGQDRAAGIAENVLHAFTLQTFPKNLRTCLHHTICIPHSI
jgi:hypothetical protein